jgi:hypothetical protein
MAIVRGSKRTKKPSLPDWYPLAIYERELSIEEWLPQIALRASLQSIQESRSTGRYGGLTAANDDLRSTFISVIVEGNYGKEGFLSEAKSENFWPIRSPTPFQIYYFAELLKKKGIQRHRNGQSSWR